MGMKKKIIFIVGILFSLGFGWFGGIVVNEINKQPAAPVSAPAQVATPVLPNVDDLWRGTNSERKKAGISPLDRSPALDASAAAKCDDMQAKNYWSHTAPDGTSYAHFIVDQIGYHFAGENLAKDTGDAKETVAAWMASPEHRRNIMDDKYTIVGYAVCNGPVGVVTVQHFVGH